MIRPAGYSPKAKKRPVNEESLKARTRQALAHEIGFVANPSFKEFDADRSLRREKEEVSSATTIEKSSIAKQRSPLPAHLERLCSTPLLSPSEERDLFCRMNYLKYRANAVRSTLNEKRPSLRKLQEIDELLARANELRNRIVNANLRLVVSIVKKIADELNPFDDLLSEGISCLLKAAEKFDFDRGFRFSTYATLAVQREVFRSVNRSHRDRTRFAPTTNNSLEQLPENERPAERTEAALLKINHDIDQMLGRLDERERLIVKARYGLIDIGMKPTFSKLGEMLGVSKERVRQLELRAMDKLRTLVDELRLAELRSLV